MEVPQKEAPNSPGLAVLVLLALGQLIATLSAADIVVRRRTAFDLIWVVGIPAGSRLRATSSAFAARSCRKVVRVSAAPH
jgi:hypothetical protein